MLYLDSNWWPRNKKWDKKRWLWWVVTGGVIFDMVVPLLWAWRGSVKMFVSGLTGNPCCQRIPLHGPRTPSRRDSAFLNAEKPIDNVKLLGPKRYLWVIIKHYTSFRRFCTLWYLFFFFFCLLQLRRSYLAGSVQRCNVKETYLVNCAMDASYGGDMSNDRSGNIFFLDHLNFYNLHIGFWT